MTASPMNFSTVPPNRLDVLFEQLVVRAQRRTDVLGVGAFGERGESDEVDEEHRDDLALLSGGCFRR